MAEVVEEEKKKKEEEGEEVALEVAEGKGKDGKEEMGRREKWASKTEFLLSCLGYAVGLGNVWRFPFLCGENGGAAFLIPYFLALTFCGFPIFYLEVALGQYAGITSRKLFARLSPLLTGLGFSMAAAYVFTAIYYNMIIAWAMYYLGASFSGITGDPMPWSDCSNPWNTAVCYDDLKASQCKAYGNKSLQEYFYNNTPSEREEFFLGRCYNLSEARRTFYLGESVFSYLKNDSRLTADVREAKHEQPAQQYNRYMMGEGKLEDGIGYPKWDLVLSLFGAWVLVFVCIVKGIKASGKVVYFTATFPYVLLVILLVRGNMLPGSEDGLEFFLKPNMTYLAAWQPWHRAVGQIFFSLSIGSPGLSTLSSFNKFSNNLMLDTLIVCLGNSATSILAGFTVFPIIGYIAKAVYPNMPAQQRVAKFAKGGTNLAFVSYPSALDRLPQPWLWNILFFLMLVLLGIDSQMVIVESVVTMFVDEYPVLRRSWVKKGAFIAATCLAFFLCGLILTTPIGGNVLGLLDTFGGSLPLLMNGLIEVSVVAYIYGFKRFIGNIREMMGPPPNLFWRMIGYPVNPYWWICWVGITPAYLVFAIGVSFYDKAANPDAEPTWFTMIGWAIYIFCIGWTPVFAAIRAYQLRKFPLSTLTQPTAEWGPQENKEDEPKDVDEAIGDSPLAVKETPPLSPSQPKITE